MLHGEPPLHITPLEEGGDDDHVMSEPGELERAAGGPAVEIQVRYPGAELQLDIPADLTEDSTKIGLAHEDMEFGSGPRSGTGERSGQPVHESKKCNMRRKLDQSWIIGWRCEGDLLSGSGQPEREKVPLHFFLFGRMMGEFTSAGNLGSCRLEESITSRLGLLLFCSWCERKL